MKHLLLTTIAAVLVVGCGNPEADRALLEAARDGNLEAVKQHLAAGTDVNAKDKHGSTSLHLAAREGHKEIGLVGKEIVELLIANGADVNASSRHGTPLDVAIFNKHPETADLLRKHGGKTGVELKAEGK